MPVESFDHLPTAHANRADHTDTGSFGFEGRDRPSNLDAAKVAYRSPHRVGSAIDLLGYVDCCHQILPLPSYSASLLAHHHLVYRSDYFRAAI